MAVLARMGNARAGERLVFPGKLLGALERMEKGQEARERFTGRQAVDDGSRGGTDEHLVLVCGLSYQR